MALVTAGRVGGVADAGPRVRMGAGVLVVAAMPVVVEMRGARDMHAVQAFRCAFESGLRGQSVRIARLDLCRREIGLRADVRWACRLEGWARCLRFSG